MLEMPRVDNPITYPQRDTMTETDAAKDKAWAEKMIPLLQKFRRSEGNLTIDQALLFLLVIKHGGQGSPKELAKEINLSPSGATNAFKVLSEAGRTNPNGWGVVEDIPHPTDGRSKVMRLTQRGRDLLRDVKTSSKSLALTISGLNNTSGGFS